MGILVGEDVAAPGSLSCGRTCSDGSRFGVPKIGESVVGLEIRLSDLIDVTGIIPKSIMDSLAGGFWPLPPMGRSVVMETRRVGGDMELFRRRILSALVDDKLLRLGMRDGEPVPVFTTRSNPF